jgi:membrane-associated protease RseP (regulator of RpoE activity)
MLMELLVLCVAILICTIVHIASMAAAGWLVNASIGRVSLFFGPLIHSINIGNISFDLRAFPVGGFVKFTDDFQKIHPLRRAFVPLCACLALLIVSVAILGVSGGVVRFGRGFYQVFTGALFPRAVGAKLLVNIFQATAERTFITTIGVVAGKMAAANLLPLPILNGGEILLLLISTVKPIPHTVRDRIHQIGLLVFLPILLLWLVAFLFFAKWFLTA